MAARVAWLSTAPVKALALVHPAEVQLEGKECEKPPLPPRRREGTAGERQDGRSPGSGERRLRRGCPHARAALPARRRRERGDRARRAGGHVFFDRTVPGRFVVGPWCPLPFRSCKRALRVPRTGSTSSSSIPANVRTTTTIGGDGMQYTFALPPTCGAPLSSPPAGSCRRAGNSSARAAYVQMNRSPTILMRQRSLGSTVTCSQGGAGVKLSVSRREQPTSPTVPHGAPMRRGAARKVTT